MIVLSETVRHKHLLLAGVAQLLICGFILGKIHSWAWNRSAFVTCPHQVAENAHYVPDWTLPSTHSSATVSGTKRRVHVLAMKGPNRSRGEVIRIHRPFAIGYGKKLRSKDDLLRRLRCTDFSKTLIITSQSCLDLCKPRERAYVDSSYRQVMARMPAGCIDKNVCNKGTALFYPIHRRDGNVCHILMKLLFGFSVYKRALVTPHWLNIPPVQTVIILSPGDILKRRLPFHIGLVKALLSQYGI